MKATRVFSLTIVFILLAGMLISSSTPARGATPILQFSAPGGVTCGPTSINVSYSEVRDYPATGMSVEDRGLIDDSLVEGPTTFTPPGAPSNTGTYPSGATYTFTDRGATSFTYKREWSLYQGATLVSRSTLVIGCYWNGSGFFNGHLSVMNEDFGAPPTDPPPTDPVPTDPVPTDPAPTDPAPTDPAPTDPAPSTPVVRVQPFAGPALPGPDARNLVLFNEDTAVLSGPDGTFTGQILRACQTAYVTRTSDDGQWGQLFVMGGWVPMANTRDVPEDYGQPGSPVAPDCVGK
ncbi:MAG: hypothetical protein IT323_15390 [Anaerolineae bacterium]|nr:hypothetical protein [Anaerolineae bacterium]